MWTTYFHVAASIAQLELVAQQGLSLGVMRLYGDLFSSEGGAMNNKGGRCLHSKETDKISRKRYGHFLRLSLDKRKTLFFLE